MDEYQEFLNKLQKRGSKPYKLPHCLGTRDAWKWVRKNKWKALNGKTIDKLVYSKIINEVNKILAEQLVEGHIIEFPYHMGFLSLASLPARVTFEGDEIVTNYRTDWEKTLPLWFKDEEARNSHKTIRRVQKRIYFIRYSKRKTIYVNKKFYLFRANRSLVRLVGREANERKLLTEPAENVY